MPIVYCFLFLLSHLPIIDGGQHPFYVSVTDAHYKKNTRSLEIAQKVFWDDMEEALKKNYKTSLNLMKGTPKDSLTIWLKNYTLGHHEWKVNGQKLILEYVGSEIEDDVIWLYLLAKNVGEPRKIEIKNSLLTDYFQDQKNITHFYLNEKPKSIITYKKRTWGELNF